MKTQLLKQSVLDDLFLANQQMLAQVVSRWFSGNLQLPKFCLQVSRHQDVRARSTRIWNIADYFHLFNHFNNLVYEIMITPLALNWPIWGQLEFFILFLANALNHCEIVIMFFPDTAEMLPMHIEIRYSFISRNQLKIIEKHLNVSVAWSMIQRIGSVISIDVCPDFSCTTANSPSEFIAFHWGLTLFEALHSVFALWNFRFH